MNNDAILFGFMQGKNKPTIYEALKNACFAVDAHYIKSLLANLVEIFFVIRRLVLRYIGVIDLI